MYGDKPKGETKYKFKPKKHVFELIAVNYFPVLWGYNISSKVYIN